MGRTVTSLLFVLSLMPSVASAQSIFHCYPAMTEIGTVARRDFTDENGFVVTTIYYGSRESRLQPSCSEGTLRIQSVRTFERDALGRVMVERDGLFPALAPVVRYEYNSNDVWPSRRTLFGPDGSRRYEIGYSGRQSRSHIYFDASDRVVGINGDVPSDVVLAFEWGAEADDWTCGIALASEHSGRLHRVNLHLHNRSNAQVSTPFVQFFETELRETRLRSRSPSSIDESASSCGAGRPEALQFPARRAAIRLESRWHQTSSRRSATSRASRPMTSTRMKSKCCRSRGVSPA